MSYLHYNKILNILLLHYTPFNILFQLFITLKSILLLHINSVKVCIYGKCFIYSKFLWEFLMYDEKMFAKRIEQLRLEKDVSAREMSLALGQNPSYINRIENGKALPSLIIFFYICDYFQITPKDFFDTEQNNFHYRGELIKEILKLTGPQAQHLLAIIKDINQLSQK